MTNTEQRIMASFFIAISVLFTGSLALTAGAMQSTAQKLQFQNCLKSGGLAGDCEAIAYNLK